jgi:hypothetical protein
MQEKINNYELIFDLWINEKISKNQFIKAFGLIRIGQFESIKFEPFGNKVTINKKPCQQY